MCTVLCEGKVMDDIILHLGFFLQILQVEQFPFELVPKVDSNITITEDISQHGCEDHADLGGHQG